MKKYSYIMWLSAIAFINASYLSYKAYYFKFVDPVGLTSFCDFTKTASCTEVLRHPLANFFGIPFPWIALVVYPILFGLAVIGYRNLANSKNNKESQESKNKDLSKKEEKKCNKKIAKSLQALSLGGIIFNSIVIYRETFYIKAFCPLCLMCSFIILSIFIISTIIIKDIKNNKI